MHGGTRASTYVLQKGGHGVPMFLLLVVDAFLPLMVVVVGVGWHAAHHIHPLGLERSIRTAPHEQRRGRNLVLDRRNVGACLEPRRQGGWCCSITAGRDVLEYLLCHVLRREQVQEVLPVAGVVVVSENRKLI